MTLQECVSIPVRQSKSGATSQPLHIFMHGKCTVQQKRNFYFHFLYLILEILKQMIIQSHILLQVFD